MRATVKMKIHCVLQLLFLFLDEIGVYSHHSKADSAIKKTFFIGKFLKKTLAVV